MYLRRKSSAGRAHLQIVVGRRSAGDSAGAAAALGRTVRSQGHNAERGSLRTMPEGAPSPRRLADPRV
jgi:hypothetical protein